MPEGCIVEHNINPPRGSHLPKSSSDDIRPVAGLFPHIRVQPFVSGLYPGHFAHSELRQCHCSLGGGRLLDLRHHHGQSRRDREARRRASHSIDAAGLVGEMFAIRNQKVTPLYSYEKQVPFWLTMERSHVVFLAHIFLSERILVCWISHRLQGNTHSLSEFFPSLQMSATLFGQLSGVSHMLYVVWFRG